MQLNPILIGIILLIGLFSLFKYHEGLTIPWGTPITYHPQIDKKGTGCGHDQDRCATPAGGIAAAGVPTDDKYIGQECRQEKYPPRGSDDYWGWWQKNPDRGEFGTDCVPNIDKRRRSKNTWWERWNKTKEDNEVRNEKADFGAFTECSDEISNWGEKQLWKPEGWSKMKLLEGPPLMRAGTSTTCDFESFNLSPGATKIGCEYAKCPPGFKRNTENNPTDANPFKWPKNCPCIKTHQPIPNCGRQKYGECKKCIDSTDGEKITRVGNQCESTDWDNIDNCDHRVQDECRKCDEKNAYFANEDETSCKQIKKNHTSLPMCKTKYDLAHKDYLHGFCKRCNNGRGLDQRVELGNINLNNSPGAGESIFFRGCRECTGKEELGDSGECEIKKFEPLGNCLEYSVTERNKCIKCSNRYNLIDNKCEEKICQANQGFTSTGECKECNIYEYVNQNSECQIKKCRGDSLLNMETGDCYCPWGSKLNTTGCQSILPCKNGQRLNSSGTACEHFNCPWGTMIRSNKCQPLNCPPSQMINPDTGRDCITKNIQQIPYCQIPDGDKCKSCKAGFTLDVNRIRCDEKSIPNCLKQTDGICNNCISPFKKANDGLSCLLSNTRTASFKGVTGKLGERGSQGPAGDDGLRGPIGPAGLTGCRDGVGSCRGAQGPKGPQGARGVDGPTGYVGSRGKRGYKGDTAIVNTRNQYNILDKFKQFAQNINLLKK